MALAVATAFVGLMSVTTSCEKEETPGTEQTPDGGDEDGDNDGDGTVTTISGNWTAKGTYYEVAESDYVFSVGTITDGKASLQIGVMNATLKTDLGTSYKDGQYCTLVDVKDATVDEETGKITWSVPATDPDLNPDENVEAKADDTADDAEEPSTGDESTDVETPAADSFELTWTIADGKLTITYAGATFSCTALETAPEYVALPNVRPVPSSPTLYGNWTAIGTYGEDENSIFAISVATFWDDDVETTTLEVGVINEALKEQVAEYADGQYVSILKLAGVTITPDANDATKGTISGTPAGAAEGAEAVTMTYSELTATSVKVVYSEMTFSCTKNAEAEFVFVALSAGE